MKSHDSDAEFAAGFRYNGKNSDLTRPVFHQIQSRFRHHLRRDRHGIGGHNFASFHSKKLLAMLEGPTKVTVRDDPEKNPFLLRLNDQHRSELVPGRGD